MEITTESRSYFGPNIVLGLGILALGLALLLDRLGVLEAWRLLQFWPALIVLLGASIVWQALRGGPATGQRWERMIVSPGLILLLVFGGLLASHADFRHTNHFSTAATDAIKLDAILGGSRLVSTSAHFQGANVTSVMGRSVLDLRRATIQDGQRAIIDVFALMGGVDLWVPKDWIIESDTVPMLGRLDDRRGRAITHSRRDWEDNLDDWLDDQTAELPPPSPVPATSASNPSANPPHLVIRGSIVMGNLTIRS
jgi:hypothetical protein